MWDVVLAVSVTPNTFSVVQCVGVPTLALVLRVENNTFTLLQLGAIEDAKGDGIESGTTDDTAVVVQPLHTNLTSTGKKVRSASQLWGRAKRAEMINEAIELGGSAASGAENGIRVKFRQILNNKKKSKFFNWY